MSICFLDTSALQHCYLPSCYSRIVRNAVSRRANQCYVLDITVLEIASAFGRQCRRRDLTVEAYDKLNVKLWRDIQSSRLRVRPFGQREVLRARHLLRYAGVIRKRNLGSADALIAVACLELALETKEPVAFYSSDWPLYSTLKEIDAFNSGLNLRFLGTPKSGLAKTADT
jgi:predicted nucleic acid-binding protein